MDYEKKYKDALERAKKWYNAPNTDKKPTYTNRVIEEIFAELKENKGERVRKKLIDMLYKVYANTNYITCEEHEDMLAWLEKQGKHKPADKAEPRFHEGDWIVHQGTENIYQVVARIDNQYQLKYGDNYTVQKCANVDRLARLWDITKDAKKGDVLALSYASKNYIIIYRGLYEKSFETIMSVFCFYSVEEDMYYDETDSFHAINTGEAIKPATKEQRDLLFQKMKEAGYVWDAENKTLSKCVIDEGKSGKMMKSEKVNPTWSCEDEKIYRRLDNLIYAASYCDSRKQFSDWLKSIKERIKVE